jgi:hypothetical protein
MKMAYQKESHVICLGDVKQAALYFDKVIPVNINQLQEHSNPAQLTRDLIDGFDSSNTSINEAFLGKLEEIQSSLTVMHEIIKSLLLLKRNSNDAYNRKLCELPLDKRKAASKFVNYFVSAIDNESKEAFTKELANILLGFSYMEGVEINNGITISTLIDQLSPLTKSKSLSVLLPEKCLLSEDENNCDVSLILPNLNLIDTSETSWKQILEFRKDNDASTKLRNLRLFFENNYSGKDRRYIEDDLMKQLDDYDQIVKEWQFKTITSTMGVILDSKNIQTSFYAALAGICIGVPILISGALIAGTCIEIGKCVLHFTNCIHSFKNKIRNNDLAYIIEGKERLE